MPDQSPSASPTATRSTVGHNPTPKPERSQTAESRVPDTVTLPRSSWPLAPGEIVLRRRLAGTWNIVVLDTGAGHERTLTTNGWRSTDAIVSPDRHTVLYLRREANGVKTLHAMSADGRTDIPLFSDHTADCPVLQRPALRSDRLLAIACSGLPYGTRLILTRLDGRLIRELDRGNLGDPTFLNDSVVYWRNGGDPNVNGGSLYAIAASGDGSRRKLTDGRSLDSDPAGSPDGRHIALSRSDGRRRWIEILDIHADATSGEWQLTDGLESDRDPSWSPRSDQLAFRRGPEANSDLFVVRLPSDQPRQVVRNPDHDGAPAWTSR
jgi:hypothetical protein